MHQLEEMTMGWGIWGSRYPALTVMVRARFAVSQLERTGACWLLYQEKVEHFAHLTTERLLCLRELAKSC